MRKRQIGVNVDELTSSLSRIREEALLQTFRYHKAARRANHCLHPCIPPLRVWKAPSTYAHSRRNKWPKALHLVKRLMSG